MSWKYISASFTALLIVGMFSYFIYNEAMATQETQVLKKVELDYVKKENLEKAVKERSPYLKDKENLNYKLVIIEKAISIQKDEISHIKQEIYASKEKQEKMDAKLDEIIRILQQN